VNFNLFKGIANALRPKNKGSTAIIRDYPIPACPMPQQAPPIGVQLRPTRKGKPGPARASNDASGRFGGANAGTKIAQKIALNYA
jgi:hypothetical protein